jgi:F-type H+-transporting ATPase subunit b
MISQFILLTALEEKTGGLFDFDGTLPFIIIQFAVLTLILNSILYSPILKVFSERQDYITKNLETASTILSSTNEFETMYKEKIEKYQKDTEVCVSEFDKICTEKFSLECKNSQSSIKKIIDDIFEEIENEKIDILSSLRKEEIDFLSTQIIKKLIV